MQRSASFVADQVAFVQQQNAAILASVNGVPGEWYMRAQVDRSGFATFFTQG